MTAPSHGHPKLLDGGSIQIAFAYHNGDQAIPKAQTENFFNSLLEIMPCWPISCAQLLLDPLLQRRQQTLNRRQARQQVRSTFIVF